ncbi:MAG: hypothetical protein QXG01_07580 [Candidatus Bathyarchaeia archaeon]
MAIIASEFIGAHGLLFGISSIEMYLSKFLDVGLYIKVKRNDEAGPKQIGC